MVQGILKSCCRSSPDKKEQLWYPTKAMLLLEDLKTESKKVIECCLERLIQGGKLKLLFDHKLDFIPAKLLIVQAHTLLFPQNMRCKCNEADIGIHTS